MATMRHYNKEGARVDQDGAMILTTSMAVEILRAMPVKAIRRTWTDGELRTLLTVATGGDHVDTWDKETRRAVDKIYRAWGPKV